MRILDFSDGFESATEPTSVGFPASNVSVTPTGNLASDKAQDALVELQVDIDGLDTRLDAAEADIDTAQADLIALDGRLDTVETTLPNKANTTALNSHTSDTGNPHGVTAAQVGNTTAQWNADKLQGVSVSSTSPTNGQILKYNGTTWAPDNEATAPALPTIQVFTSGSGTYTTPAGVRYLRVRLVGGGGGGAGSGTTAGTAAGNGGTTTFGTSLIGAGGGNGGVQSAYVNGGSPTISAPAYGIARTGESGGGSQRNGTNAVYLMGGIGGSTPFGPGGSSSYDLNGTSAQANSGAGGGGAGGNNTANLITGGAGASGGYVDAFIPSPSSTYSYTVGAGGSGGGAGTGGRTGGAGASGVIVVEEYY